MTPAPEGRCRGARGHRAQRCCVAGGGGWCRCMAPGRRPQGTIGPSCIALLAGCSDGGGAPPGNRDPAACTCLRGRIANPRRTLGARRGARRVAHAHVPRKATAPRAAPTSASGPNCAMAPPREPAHLATAAGGVAAVRRAYGRSAPACMVPCAGGRLLLRCRVCQRRPAGCNVAPRGCLRALPQWPVPRRCGVRGSAPPPKTMRQPRRRDAHRPGRLALGATPRQCGRRLWGRAGLRAPAAWASGAKAAALRLLPGGCSVGAAGVVAPARPRAARSA